MSPGPQNSIDSIQQLVPGACTSQMLTAILNNPLGQVQSHVDLHLPETKESL